MQVSLNNQSKGPGTSQGAHHTSMCSLYFRELIISNLKWNPINKLIYINTVNTTGLLHVRMPRSIMKKGGGGDSGEGWEECMVSSSNGYKT